MSKRHISVLFFLIGSVACGQQAGPKLTLEKIEDALEAGKPVAEINQQITKRGIGFCASDEVHQGLISRHIEPRTWALIEKSAPICWEKRNRSAPNISQLAVSGGRLFAADSTDQMEFSADHGDTWNPVPNPLLFKDKYSGKMVADYITAVASCGPYWIAGGRGPHSPYELSVFFSDDARIKTFNSEYSNRISLACDGDSVMVGAGDAIMASSDHGGSWHEWSKDAEAEALRLKDGSIDALVLVGLTHWDYCGEKKGAAMECHPTDIGMRAMARVGDTVCIGGENLEFSGVEVSFNQGKSWSDGGIWPKDTDDKVTTLFAVGDHVAAGTGGHGVLLGNENCKSWNEVGAGAPKDIRSIVSDEKYLYAGAGDGVWRFPVSAVLKKAPSALPKKK